MDRNEQEWTGEVVIEWSDSDGMEWDGMIVEWSRVEGKEGRSQVSLGMTVEVYSIRLSRLRDLVK